MQKVTLVILFILDGIKELVARPDCHMPLLAASPSLLHNCHLELRKKFLAALDVVFFFMVQEEVMSR